MVYGECRTVAVLRVVKQEGAMVPTQVVVPAMLVVVGIIASTVCSNVVLSLHAYRHHGVCIYCTFYSLT